MPSDRTLAATAGLVARVAGLLLFGIFFESVVRAAETALPHEIYTAASFTLAIVERQPIALVVAVASLLFAGWLLSPLGRARLSWSLVDRVGGLRWPVFVVGATLAWAYAGHRFNFYFGQPHLWDRLLLGLSLFATLRSPLLIPVFTAQLLLARGQFHHPINSLTPIGDELPLRVLGMVAGCALWNGVAGRLEAGRACLRHARLQRWCSAARIPTHCLTYAILCLVGFCYVFAGLGKVWLGASPLDWVRFGHMENLFVASYLNGWFQDLPEARVLELADSIRSVSVPIAAATVILEIGMFAVLLRPRMTLLLLGAIAAMHVGIVWMTGIVFWKWLALDLSLLGWLWLRRKDEELRRMYSLPGFVVSLVLICGIIAGFGHNRFSWWNTKWIQVYEIEAVDAAGNVYLVDYSNFLPYTLFDLYEHQERRIQTRVYGMTLDQRLMEMLEATDSRELQGFFAGPRESGDAPAQRTQKRIFGDFMKRHFEHRNRRPGLTVAPFWLPSPSLHNRYLSAPNLYRDQAPVVEVRLRVVEVFYTGSELHRIRSQVVHAIPIPQS